TCLTATTSLFPITIRSYGPRRDLPSFPTRRSSDLRRVRGSRGRKGRGCAPRSRVEARPGPLSPAGRGRGPPSLSRRGRSRLDDSDRKSTRLNSSHLGISYAVFCLKKKKKKKQT